MIYNTVFIPFSKNRYNISLFSIYWDITIINWKLEKNDWNGDSSSDELFKKWAGILSGPVALWGLILFNNFITQLVLIFISGMVGEDFDLYLAW